MKPSIVIDRLEKRFDGLTAPAVSALSTEIQCGMITGLVGPDGAGKTTLSQLLSQHYNSKLMLEEFAEN